MAWMRMIGRSLGRRSALKRDDFYFWSLDCCFICLFPWEIWCCKRLPYKKFHDDKMKKNQKRYWLRRV